jgi:DNA-directed RNA polymerase subunit RPC12/RpoP
MNSACPHCGAPIDLSGRAILVGEPSIVACPKCGNRCFVKPNARRSVAGLAFFLFALGVALLVDRGEIYNLSIVTRFPILFWGAVFALVGLLVQLAIALAAPLAKNAP